MVMHPLTRLRPLLALVTVLFLNSCGERGEAQRSSDPVNQASSADPLIADLLKSLSVAEEKYLALADEFGQEQYDWRPATGVRSGAEVFMHVARINYSVTLFTGHEIVASTGVAGDVVSGSACDFRRLEGCQDEPALNSEYETSVKNKNDVRMELSASFESLSPAIAATSTSELQREVTTPFQTTTLRAFWIGHVNHIHEHLGQLIAYSRMNGVVPPWSR